MASWGKTEQGIPKWMVLLTVIVGTFLGRLDQTIVNLALPKIIGDFSISVSAAGWIATAYILANAIFVPIWGKLGDTIGKKKVYIWGFAIFIVGSVLAGLAWNLSSMIAFRIIQAIAGSADYPTAMAILAVTFTDGKQRSQALGIWSSSFAVASVFGPLLGGPLIDNFGWRSVFLINLPVGLVGLGMALTYIHEAAIPYVKRKFDWWGAITLGTALGALVLVLDQGVDWGWLSVNSIVTYLTIVVSFILFVVIEKRHPEPIVNLKFFSNSIFVGALINNFVVFMGMMGSIFLIPIFAQTFLGYDATQAGLLFIPMAITFMVAAPLGGSLIGKYEPRYVIAVSTFLAGVGIFLFSFIDARSGPWAIMLPLAIMAFSLGFGMAQRTGIVASAVDPHEIGTASSVLALVRNIAGAFGIAIFATILGNFTKTNVLSIAKQSAFHLTASSEFQQAIALISLKAQIKAYDEIFILSGALLIIGAIVALFMKIDKKNLREDVEIFVE